MKKYPIKCKIESSYEGMFGAKRKYDFHTGLDLYCVEGTEVFALEDGEVKKVQPFTGVNAESDWWENTDYIGVLSESGYIVYGEIESLVAEGQHVKEGDLIGKVKRVLKKDKGRPTCMLHLELYSQYVDEPVIWFENQSRPKFLKDPTSLFNLPRFDHDASNFLEAYNYIKNRTKQLLPDKVVLDRVEQKEYGVLAFFQYDFIMHVSLFLYPEYRGKGIYKKVIDNLHLNVITIDECHILKFLEKNYLHYVELGHFIKTNEYQMISNFYGSKKAKRSGLYLMNHIDEGLRILTDLGASDATKKAYCLHPILQSNEFLKQNYQNKSILEKTSPEVVILAMEYRNIANKYLSTNENASLMDIELSCLNEVNLMLTADKIQNYKDFQLYQREHPRFTELSKYFKNWLRKLNIPDAAYDHYFDVLKANN
jgi:GNAT superfamily N-acetyltransferase